MTTLAKPRLAVVAVLGWVALGGCRDHEKPPWQIMPEMVTSVPYDSFAPNPNTKDGKTLLLPPAGAIPRGFQPFDYGPGAEEYRRAGDELENPEPATPEVLARGKMVFDTFCFECHNHDGQGKGPVVPPFPPPPSLTADHACSMVDGKIFWVMAHGQGMMPSYASQIPQDDRWKVVRYLRTLQPEGCGVDDE
jgi:mono/diheme cytochrome c family protein